MFACAAACLAKQLRQPVIPQLLAGILDVRLRCRFEKRSSASKSYAVYPYFLGFLMFACAAASLAIGTRKGEQDT